MISTLLDRAVHRGLLSCGLSNTPCSNWYTPAVLPGVSTTTSSPRENCTLLATQMDMKMSYGCYWYRKRALVHAPQRGNGVIQLGFSSLRPQALKAGYLGPFWSWVGRSEMVEGEGGIHGW